MDLYLLMPQNSIDWEEDPRWPIANIWGLQLSVKAQRTRGRNTFRQIQVAHGAEDPQCRSHTGHQHDSCGRRSGFAGTSAQQLLEQSKQGWLPFGPRFGGPTRAPSTTPEAGAVAVTAPRHRVNETGSPSDGGLEPREGRVAYFGHKKEARQENPGQKSTINLNAAVLALGTNNLDVHSRDLI